MRLPILFAAAIVALPTAAPTAAQVNVEDLKSLTSCTPGRVWVWNGTEPVPATMAGPGPTADTCMLFIDDHIGNGPIETKMVGISSVQAPAAPDARMFELGRLATISLTQEREMRAMAETSHANARIFFSRFDLTVNDSLVVARICNINKASGICARANAAFHGGVTANNQVIDARNAQAEAAAREARADSEPVNSGYYSSGAGSVSGPYKPSSGSTSSPPVPAVQSESEIRKGQAACRAGSGPC
ncbi:MAG: hypothetical protein Q7T68_03860 [Sphingopyxis sp.]|nr:hypothetical protein [Sphingopyxis sp.]